MPNRRPSTASADQAPAAATPAKAGDTPTAIAAPDQVAKPAKSVKPAKPAKPTKAPKPARGTADKAPAAKAPAPKPAVRTAKPAAAAAPVKAAKPAKPAKPAKAPKAQKLRQKPVRDSFTMPEADFSLIQTLKARALGAQRETKKSELLRAGLHALAAMDSAALLAALNTLEPVKLGRPKQPD